MFVYSPWGIGAGRTWYGWSNSSVVSPKWKPAWNAAVFAARTRSSLNRLVIQSMVDSTGRENSHEMRPSAKKFLERSASRFLTPSGSAAWIVSDVIGTSTTR
jgi:hypothetical protein